MTRPEPPPPSIQAALPGILILVAGVTLFSISDALSKLLRERLSAVEIAWVRYIVFVLFAGAIAARGGVRGLWPKRPGLQTLRAVTLLGSGVLFIEGLRFMPLAEAAAISYVSPAFITALSIPVLGEVVGIRRWAAVAVGLLGVLIVIRPGAGLMQAAALLPLSSAACWAIAIVCTRRMGAADRSETTLLWSAVVGLLLLTLFVPFDFTVPTWRELGILLTLGILASSGQYLMILAYRRAAASVLAPFSYVQLLSSIVMGVIAFGAVPDGWTLVGAGVIVLSGVYTAHRERVRAREASRDPRSGTRPPSG